MAFLAALIIAALLWAVWKRKLSAQQLLPLILGIAGAFLVARGNFIVGALTAGVAIIWYRGMTARLFRPGNAQADAEAIDQARFMLGVSWFDNAESIRERHDALMAKNRPETAGSAERARELNAARDLLLRELRDRSLTAKRKNEV
jgi:hypothetical protein